VFTPTTRRPGIAPFDVRAVTSTQSSTPWTRTLHLAGRCSTRPPARARDAARESEAELDVAEVQAALTGIRETLELVRGLKVQLTNIGTSFGQRSKALDKLREAILAWITEPNGSCGRRRDPGDPRRWRLRRIAHALQVRSRSVLAAALRLTRLTTSQYR
jgi:hypothetical protein